MRSPVLLHGTIGGLDGETLTIAAAWVRHFGLSEELVFASDSRLRWAGAWDSCPKIFCLPRTDAVIAFAGDTMWAYPIIAQTANHIAAFRPSLRRENDLLEAKGHALRVVNANDPNGGALRVQKHLTTTRPSFSAAIARPRLASACGGSGTAPLLERTRLSAFVRGTLASTASSVTWPTLPRIACGLCFESENESIGVWTWSRSKSFGSFFARHSRHNRRSRPAREGVPAHEL